LCAEPRDGCCTSSCRRCSTLDDYLELVAAIEATAADLRVPSCSKATSRRRDPRLTHFRVTPDPGVIEVNIQPAAAWDRTGRADDAPLRRGHLSRLSTEKFMLDGRHTGTGGGNHFVLGGATPDSPFLRRPDLLRSLVSYWHNHPSLSYLFSGPVHRPDQPGAARRRGAQRRSTSSRSPSASCRRLGKRSACRPGWSTACCATC
jgi:uncharacterized protein (DUF2126 family)